MAGALKHKQRSHRSYGKNRDFKAFERKALIKTEAKNTKSFFDKFKEFFRKPQSRQKEKEVKYEV